MKNNDCETDQKKILCAGYCVFDIIHVCEVYPQEDSETRLTEGHCQRGGNASNNCTVLRQLGAECEFLGVLSTSKAFQFLIEDFKNRGVEIKNCPKITQNPSFSSILLNKTTGSRTIISTNSSLTILKYNDFKKINLNEYEWIHFEGRNPDETKNMINDVVEYNSKKSEDEQIVISVEFEVHDKKVLNLGNHADYIFLEKDFSLFLGWNDMKTAVYELQKILNNKQTTIICSWGSLGSCVLECDEYSEVEAIKLDKVVDSLGAGDTFCASVIYALNNLNKSPKEAIKFGNYIAGNNCKYYGYDEIQKFKNSYPENTK